jgi:hypothetical protein
LLWNQNQRIRVSGQSPGLRPASPREFKIHFGFDYFEKEKGAAAGFVVHRERLKASSEITGAELKRIVTTACAACASTSDHHDLLWRQQETGSRLDILMACGIECRNRRARIESGSRCIGGRI